MTGPLKTLLRATVLAYVINILGQYQIAKQCH